MGSKVKRAKVLKTPEPANGEPSTARTPRMRYVEPPRGSDGRPFVAFRVRGELRDAFAKYANKRKTSTAALFRAYMSKATGLPVEVAEGEDE